MTTADLDTASDDRRARRLRAMKWRAGGLLVFATVVYLFTVVRSLDEGVWGFVRAAAEAGMVGGVADWFAVTALFRHPLGIPIPHTALIPRGKEAIGQGLGDFIARNFLDPDHLVERIEAADPARRLGAWLVQPANATVAARQASVVIAGMADALADDEVQAGIREAVTERIRAIEVTPVIGALVDWTLEGNHHQALVGGALRGVARAMDDNKTLLRDRLGTESPWWVPEQLDDAVFRRLYDGVQSFIEEIAADPGHPIRRHVDDRARAFAAELRDSAGLQRRGEEIRDELLDHPQFREWTDSLWTELKRTISDAAESPESELRARLERAAVETGARLLSDRHLCHQVNAWVTSLAGQIARQSGDEVARLVSSTVDRWDAEETSRRLELQVGRDLQFIRINGTIVGALVGVAIHGAAHLFR